MKYGHARSPFLARPYPDLKLPRISAWLRRILQLNSTVIVTSMRAYQYTLDKQGRRVLRGLNFEETTELELIEARTALVYPVAAASARDEDRRWLELFNKYQHALQSA